MTRCQTDRMHNDGSSRQHGRQQCAWPSMAKRPDHKKGRPLAEWLSSPGRGRSWPFSLAHGLLFYRRRSHDSEFALSRLDDSARKRQAVVRRDGGVAAAGGNVPGHAYCCREKQGIELAKPPFNALFLHRAVCPMQTASLAGAADWPDGATAVCLDFSARVPDCRFASNRTVAVRLCGESQQCVLSLVCRRHGKQNLLFFDRFLQIKVTPKNFTHDKAEIGPIAPTLCTHFWGK